jgi:hypothetical protein
MMNAVKPVIPSLARSARGIRCIGSCTPHISLVEAALGGALKVERLR